MARACQIAAAKITSNSPRIMADQIGSVSDGNGQIADRAGELGGAILERAFDIVERGLDCVTVTAGHIGVEIAERRSHRMSADPDRAGDEISLAVGDGHDAIRAALHDRAEPALVILENLPRRSGGRSGHVKHATDEGGSSFCDVAVAKGLN